MNSNIEQINYSPNFNININTYTKYIDENDYSDSDAYYDTFSDCSDTLQHFYYNMPSKVINSIDELKSSINTLINFISNCDDNLLESYNNNTISDDVCENNFYDIGGSSRLETVMCLSSINDELHLLYSKVSNNIYGEDNITYDDASIIDIDSFKFLKNIEQQSSFENINYLSLHVENIIMYIIQNYLSIISEDVLSFVNTDDYNSDFSISNLEYKDQMLKNFYKNAKKMKNYVCKDEKTMYNIEVAMDNIFLSLQEYEDFLHNENEVNLQLYDNDIFEMLNNDYTQSLSNSIDDFYKVLMQNVHNKKSLFKCINLKNSIRKIYK